MSETSIPRLFLAGLIPGVVVTGLLMITTYIIARRRNYGGTGKKFTCSPFLSALWEGKWSIFAPVLIIGGIYSGAFTPTEAAAVAVFYSLFVGLYVYGELTKEKIIEALQFTALLTGILILIAPTMVFGQLTAFYDIPNVVQTYITSITNDPLMVLLLIAIFYIIIGTFMESIAQVVLFTGVFFPLIVSLGIDPVLFGIFTVITCEIGFLTPPLGANLTVASRISKVSIERISVAVLPFILAYIIGLAIIVLFPELTLFLPDYVYGVSK